MQKLKPWQYSGVLTEDKSQPLPSPLEFIKMCGVTSANPASKLALESLILGRLCMETNTHNKKVLLTETLKLLKNGTTLL